MKKRVFLIVLDSFGIGDAPDAEKFGDLGANTLQSVMKSDKFSVENMRKIGLFNIDGVKSDKKIHETLGSFARVEEKSMGKDTTIGHWEISGIVSEKPLPTYPNGFPKEVLDKFELATGRKVICNLPYSGTDVIRDYGKEHVETGALIVYTSADSVFQIAAHEDVVPINTLYVYCKMAREILSGEHGVGRIIARPFTGEYPDFKRTTNRHDYSLLPPKATALDALITAGFSTYGVGKIYDIFAGVGIQNSQTITGNVDGMNKSIAMLDTDFEGLCFINLVDFDMLYGHRNDVEGYANALTEFDCQLGEFMSKMKEDDILIITADHGCDPGFKGTDHSRETVPMLIYGNKIKVNNNLHVRKTFADIGATILDIFGVENSTDGQSFKAEISKGEV